MGVPSLGWYSIREKIHLFLSIVQGAIIILIILGRARVGILGITEIASFSGIAIGLSVKPPLVIIVLSFLYVFVLLYKLLVTRATLVRTVSLIL